MPYSTVANSIIFWSNHLEYIAMVFFLSLAIWIGYKRKKVGWFYKDNLNSKQLKK